MYHVCVFICRSHQLHSTAYCMFGLRKQERQTWFVSGWLIRYKINVNEKQVICSPFAGHFFTSTFFRWFKVEWLGYWNPSAGWVGSPDLRKNDVMSLTYVSLKGWCPEERGIPTRNDSKIQVGELMMSLIWWFGSPCSLACLPSSALVVSLPMKHAGGVGETPNVSDSRPATLTVEGAFLLVPRGCPKQLLQINKQFLNISLLF